jgi:hypothetical protein
MNKLSLQKLFNKPYFWDAILILFTGSIYIATLLPGVGDNGDTAKFQFIGRFLGTPHSTGYPTYIFLNHIFTLFFPIGSIAYRANLLSAVFTVAALVFLSHNFCVLGLPRPMATLTTMTLGFTPTVWRYSLLAEVYSLHLLFVSMVCFFLISWYKNRRDADLLMGLGAYAFSFGNHMTTITLLPAIFFLIWITDRKIFIDVKKISWVIGFIVLSALQYTYFVWRTFDPNTIYLEMSAPDLKTFLWFVTGSYFRTQMFAFSAKELILDRIPFFLGLLWSELGIFILISILGILVYLRRDWRITLFLLLGFAGNTFYALNYRIQDIFPFFIPSYYYLVVFIGLGLLAAKEWFFKKRTALIYAFIWVLPAALLITNYSKVDLHKATAKINETQAIVNHTLPNSLVITSDYNVYEYMMYYWAAEGWRENNIYLMSSLNIDALSAYIQQDQPKYTSLGLKAPPGLNIYFAGISEEDIQTLRQKGIFITPIKEGLLFKYEP